MTFLATSQPMVCAPSPLPSADDSAAAALPAGALRVGALGSLQVEIAGRSAAGGMGSARSRELLVFLLLQPGGATKEEVGAALWPEASASQIRNSFHVTLHRLRGLLGHPEAIVVAAGRYAVAPSFLGFFDAPAFESGAKGALAAAKAGRPESAEMLAAIALYRGELLQGEPAGEWHLERRERLQRLYLDLLAATGKELRAAGRHAEAAEVYRRFVAADDHAEEAYRQLMASLESQGQIQEARRVYRQLEQVLRRELGVAPEKASREIGDRLERAAAQR